MCLWFLAHTDPTDLTDFFVGDKSHRIVRWGVGEVFGLTQISRISLIFLWVVNLTELFGGSGWFLAHTDPTLTELH